jgi:hypothetical protein
VYLCSIFSLSTGRKQVHPFFDLLLFFVELPRVASAIGWESCMFTPFWDKHVDSEACSIEEEFENYGFSDFLFYFLNDE